ncbi:MAG: ketopantoate reductase family protein [Clostridia bacterium]|nr:ketopantoate reductase family protein [Clostridia bacterium]NCC83823.1 ketopantoate reductase family protein [Clostridia bacterium]
MNIQKVAIVGMGALGLLYGEQIQKTLGKDHLSFVMDTARFQRHKTDPYIVNGAPQDFTLMDAAQATPVDLVIVATKASGLASALDVMANLVAEHTILLSVMNGISSEQILTERFGDRNLIYCVAIGMDAMRDGQSLSYVNQGKLQIGILKEEQGPALSALSQFLDRAGLAYTVESDILHALWGKFLLNVGINQACMVYETTYAGALNTPHIFATMSAAMHEVITIAAKEGIHLSEQDFEQYIKILHTLKPDGYPSMRQDALAGRKSEAELFAGTVLRLAAKHQVPAPANTFFFRRIQEMEAGYKN